MVQFVLTLTGMALGVAVVAAMFIAIDSAKRSFDHANDAVFGNVTHMLTGGPGGIDERLFTQLRLQLPSIAAAPVVLAKVTAGYGDSRRRLQLMGIDPFADTSFRSHSPSPESTLLPRFVSEPGSVVLSAATAAREGVVLGDDLEIHAAGRRVRLHVIGVLEGLNELQTAALEQVLLVDISTAQEVLGMVGRLSRIDLRVASAIGGDEPGKTDGGFVSDDVVLTDLQTMLPANVHVEAGSATLAGARADDPCLLPELAHAQRAGSGSGVVHHLQRNEFLGCSTPRFVRDVACNRCDGARTRDHGAV